MAGGDELSEYREGGQLGPSFVAIASERTLRDERGAVERITAVLMRAARLFSENPDAWVEAASTRRPDVSKPKIRKLWKFFKEDWPTNGGIDSARLGEILKSLQAKGRVPKRQVSIDELLAPEFERKALNELGVYPT